MHMLLHDIPEQHVGDTPSPTKNANKNLYDSLEAVERKWMKDNLPDYYGYMYGLNEHEAAICSFVDRYECAMKSLEEVEMGNRSAWVIFNNCVRSASRTFSTSKEMEAVFKELVKDIKMRSTRVA